MDEAQLKKIMSGLDAPPVEENAKKQALNLALAEFKTAQTESKKISQGMPFWGRLTGMSNQTGGRKPMNRKFVYGGMATAMAVVLVAGVSVQQYMSGALTRGDASTMNAAPLSKVQFNIGGDSAPLQEKFRKQDFRQEADKGKAAMVPAESQIAMQQAQNGARRTLSANEFESKDMAVVGMAMPSAPVIMMDEIAPQYYHDAGRDNFKDFEENNVKSVSAEPVSTFSIDVDTSSYSFMRRQLNAGVLPQKDAVRIEEMINYFPYDYALPETKEQPFKPTVTVMPAPWAEGHKLVHIGIKGYDIPQTAKPHSNLVFLLDVSGSMNSPDKLPLVVNSLKMLLDTMNHDDTIGIVVYAGAAGTVLEPTPVREKDKIISALENLSAGGSTAGAEGIRQAYKMAEAHFDKEGVNRVILATDGDFNVGITNEEELKDFVERQRQSGIFLSVLGFGQGNLNDSMMQTLAQNGNGVAAYIDTLGEARKVLVQEASSTLFTIAKDVKIQVEFNPATVSEYRLIGYETRHLNKEDFNNDSVDAGDIGAGHSVTAIYEITPVGAPKTVDDSRYQQQQPAAAKVEEHKADTQFGNEYAFLKIRYKLPDQDTSNLITTPVTTEDDIGIPRNGSRDMEAQTREAEWAVAVAGLGQLLKGSKYIGNFDYDAVIEMAQSAKGADEFGYRSEFIQLVRLAKSAAKLPDTGR